MSNIDKVQLYPFSPLKLLHETRKLTASQAKFFVALMCLYFERYGDLDWYCYGSGAQSGADGAEEKNAAHYAPYCGVTKRTFIKMIDALQTAGVVYINDRGCITPIIAEEIQEAVNEGMNLRNNQDGTYDIIAPVAAQTKEVEGVAAIADDMFRSGSMASDNRSEASKANFSLKAEREEKLAAQALREETKAVPPILEEDTRPMETRRADISRKIAKLPHLVEAELTKQEEENEYLEYGDYKPVAITKRVLFEARQLVRDDPRLMDLLNPLIEARDLAYKKLYGEDFVEDWVTPKVWEKLPSVLDGVQF